MQRLLAPILILLLAVTASGQAQKKSETSTSKPSAKKDKAPSKTDPKKKAEVAEPAVPEPLPPPTPSLSELSLPYPVRNIDRPYTLPEGLYDLSLQGSAVYSEGTEYDLTFLEYLTEFRFRQPLTNDFTLIWNPLPLGIQYQPKRTDFTVTGVAWNIDWQYQGNFGVEPSFESYLKSRVNKNTSIEMTLSYSIFFPFKKMGALWALEYNIGPIFQKSNTFSLSPKLGLTVDNVYLENIYQIKRTPIEAPGVKSHSSRFHVPVILWMQWTPHPNWDVSFKYTLLGLDFEGTSSAQIGTLGIVARW